VRSRACAFLSSRAKNGWPTSGLCEKRRWKKPPGFRELKDLVEMRPIYHRRPKRVRAHIFIAALAFLLARALEKKLKAARVPMSSAQVLEALRTMHIVDIRVATEIRRGVTAGNHQARQILAALGISDREPLQT